MFCAFLERAREGRLAAPWSAVDGNAYWTVSHQRSLRIHGLTMVVQSWDVGVDWRARPSGGEVVNVTI